MRQGLSAGWSASPWPNPCPNPPRPRGSCLSAPPPRCAAPRAGLSKARQPPPRAAPLTPTLPGKCYWDACDATEMLLGRTRGGWALPRCYWDVLVLEGEGSYTILSMCCYGMVPRGRRATCSTAATACTSAHCPTSPARWPLSCPTTWRLAAPSWLLSPGDARPCVAARASLLAAHCRALTTTGLDAAPWSVGAFPPPPPTPQCRR